MERSDNYDQEYSDGEIVTIKPTHEDDRDLSLVGEIIDAKFIDGAWLYEVDIKTRNKIANFRMWDLEKRD